MTSPFWGIDKARLVSGSSFLGFLEQLPGSGKRFAEPIEESQRVRGEQVRLLMIMAGFLVTKVTNHRFHQNWNSNEELQAVSK